MSVQGSLDMCADRLAAHTCSPQSRPLTSRQSSLRHSHRASHLLSSKQSVSFCGCSSLQSHKLQQSHSSHQRRRSLKVHADTDFYQVLGVERGVDKAELKKAYRQKARKFHPDVNKDAGAEDMFKKISAAYEVLNDDQKRSIYDRQAHSQMLSFALKVHAEEERLRFKSDQGSACACHAVIFQP